VKKYTRKDIYAVNKIAVIMFGLFGDILIRTPVIRALKEIYPNAEIMAIVNPIGVPILEDNPFIDNLIVVPTNSNKLQKRLHELIAVFQIRKEKFDLIVNLYNGGSSPWMVFFSHARYKLGFCQQKRKYIYNIENNCVEDRLKENQSLYNYMISILEPLSDKKYDLQPIFYTKKENDLKMGNYLKELDINKDKLYLLNLGASKENKLLDMEKTFELVRYTYETYGFIPAVISNPAQEYLQEEFISDFLIPNKLPYIKLTPLSIGAIASLMKLTKFIVTPDTGILHLAMAMDSLIYAIFTYTHPIFVDLNMKNFIAVYEHFDTGVFYKKQNMKIELLQSYMDKFIKKI